MEKLNASSLVAPGDWIEIRIGGKRIAGQVGRMDHNRIGIYCVAPDQGNRWCEPVHFAAGEWQVELSRITEMDKPRGTEYYRLTKQEFIDLLMEIVQVPASRRAAGR